jgi:hypothetical protein
LILWEKSWVIGSFFAPNCTMITFVTGINFFIIRIFRNKIDKKYFHFSTILNVIIIQILAYLVIGFITFISLDSLNTPAKQIFPTPIVPVILITISLVGFLVQHS